ncbi:Y-family DNA polymerase [Castellaniella sp.]|uniref:Y-family DNA polymerase n=1 Tax=Castellaniella sp. TaxID=1955812 RepID=UPI003A91933B
MSVWIGVYAPAGAQGLASALRRFTPDLALAPESVTLLDVSASLRLFGGIRALRAQVWQALGGRPLGPIVSVAASGPAAWMLARSGQGGSALSARALQRVLQHMPLWVAPPARPFLDWFQELGCTTLADLQRLPRVGLKKRCGPALLDWLDQLQQGGHYAFSAPPLVFQAGLELPDHTEHTPALQWAVRHLIQQLCQWLMAHQLDATTLTLLLAHDRHAALLAEATGQGPQGNHDAFGDGRVDDTQNTRLDIVLGVPTHQADTLIRLAQEHLNRLVLRASVIAVSLRVSQWQPAQTPSLQLFPEPGGSAQDHARLLALLAARLGADNIQRPVRVADHRPEVAARWIPVGAASSDIVLTPPPLPRPAWLLAQPLGLRVHQHRPFYGTPLRLVSAPERLACGWQDGHPVARDYFVAEDDAGICYWIFRQGGAQPQWFLHGLFA